MNNSNLFTFKNAHQLVKRGLLAGRRLELEDDLAGGTDVKPSFDGDGLPAVGQRHTQAAAGVGRRALVGAGAGRQAEGGEQRNGAGHLLRAGGRR